MVHKQALNIKRIFKVSYQFLIYFLILFNSSRPGVLNRGGILPPPGVILVFQGGITLRTNGKIMDSTPCIYGQHFWAAE